MFDWGGVAGDLADTALGAFDFMAGAGLASEIVKGTGYKIGGDVVRGRLQGHHPWAKFLGGPENQHLSELYQSLHSMLHRDLAAELKGAGFLNVGGRRGSTKDWADFFATNPGKEAEALEILRRVTKEFDRTNGTKVLERLDAALARGKPGSPPPTK